MPLIKRSSKKAFKKNVETEMAANPAPADRARNLAIAYSTQRAAKKRRMAKGGGVVTPEAQEIYNPDTQGKHSREPQPMPKPGYAKGGDVRESERLGRAGGPLSHFRFKLDNGHVVSVEGISREHARARAKENLTTSHVVEDLDTHLDHDKTGWDKMAKGGEVRQSNPKLEQSRLQPPKGYRIEQDHYTGMHSIRTPGGDMLNGASFPHEEDAIRAAHEHSRRMYSDGGEVDPDLTGGVVTPEMERQLHKDFDSFPKTEEELAGQENEKNFQRGLAAIDEARSQKMKQYAGGGMIDSDGKENYKDIVGGIMRKRRHLADGDVDLDSNEMEDDASPNSYDRQNRPGRDIFLADDEQLENDPMDSNEDGDEIERDKHDMVALIRHKMRLRNRGR